MKRSFLYTAVALLFGFCVAAAMCVQALMGPTAVAQVSQMRVVVDAGHGGIDGGVVGVKSGAKESDINLSLAFLLKDCLTDAGFAVTMTRSTKEGLYGDTSRGFKRRDMEKRKQIVENASPLCVISIHQNFYPSSASRGAQVFYGVGKDQSRSLAEAIQTELNGLYAEEGVKGRKTMSADYYMLRLSPPSVIVECGFLSNPKDDALLSDPSFCAKLTKGMAAGLLGYLENLAQI
jgi:N-acetylmuramoyl-L-alanine amidase